MMKRRLQTMGVGQEQRQRLNTRNLVHLFKNDPVTISPAYSNGTAVADLRTGNYVYQLLQIQVIATQEVVGKTIQRSGVHYVKTDVLHEYLTNVKLEIDATVERDLTMEQLVAFNAMDGYDTRDGLVYMVFGGPNQFHDRSIEDVYMLGTSNINNLRLLFDLGEAWGNANEFRLEIMAEYVHAEKPISNIRTMVSNRHSVASAGQYTITGLPIHSDIGAIYCVGDGIERATLEVNGKEVMEVKNYQLRGLNSLYGRDSAPLGAGVVFDFLRSGEINKALASLRSSENQRRNADIIVKVWTDAPTEINVITDQVGRYAKQR